MNQIPGQGGRTKKKKHFYINTSEKKGNSQRLLLGLAVLACAGLLIAGLVNIGGYVKDYADSQAASRAMRDLYYTAAPDHTPLLDQPSETMAPPEETTLPAQTPVPTKKPLILESKHYPNNPRAQVQDKFIALRLNNSDVTAWLKIGTQLDEAVVQRDNTYYLRRDWLGNDNSNGALFLDQDTKWQTRPYTLMVYGHNMKSGAMFGKLRSFEKHDYYQDHAIITFDTAYEDGRFVVFAVGTYSLSAKDANFLNLSRLDSRTVSVREKEIQRLLDGAVLTSPVDVQADDQLLLLITCVDNENERRILSARRVRDNETEAELITAVKTKFAY
ncbi:MAG: sortase [Clostridia bacterium]|nr:sortase [Clostridia bacterium]